MMTPCPVRVFFLSAAAAAHAVGVGAARAQEPAPAIAGMQIAEQVGLARLVDLAAERLHVDIEYSPSDLVGVVTARLGGGTLGDEELWDLLNRALSTRGFTTIRAAGDRPAMSVVKLENAAQLARPEFAETLPQETGPAPGFRSVLVRCTNRSPKEMVESLKLLITKPFGVVVEVPGGTVATPLPPASPPAEGGGGASGGLVLMADLTPRIDRALQVAQVLDARGERSAVEEVPVRHLSASQMATLATQVVSEQTTAGGRKASGKVIASPAGSSVLIVGPDSQLGRWRELVQQLDSRQPTQVVTYSPRHFDVREVASLIEQSIRERSAQADDHLRVVTDQLTGALIVAATPLQHERISALIERLDSAPQSGRRPMRTFAVRNRPVREIVEIVGRLISLGAIEPDPASADFNNSGTAKSVPDPTLPPPPLSKDASLIGGGSAASMPPPLPIGTYPPSPRQPRNAEGALGSKVPAPQAAGEMLSLTADEQTNTLIAIGEPRAIVQLEGLLSKLDVRQPQVMLEVLLISLSESDQVDLGIELERLTNSGDAAIRLSSLFGLSTSGAGGVRRVGADQTGGTVSVISPAEFSIVLTALQSLNTSRGLTIPKVLVGNNQRGQFRSNSQQPVQTIATGANNITTTAFGGYQDAGTTVTIQPQIAEGDYLRLKYSIALSAFGTGGTTGLPPPRTENALESEATIPDAYTVVVGGIDVTSETKGTTQIPFLGDIPLIGEAFKSRSNRESRSRFFAFIRAEVMRSTQFDDLKHVSGLTAAAASIDDGFPTIEPQVIR